MLCRLALLTLLGVVTACDAPPHDQDPVVRKVQEKPSALPLSRQQVDEQAALCASMSREQFRRAWSNGKENTADGPATAGYASHYNAKLNTCFYLLTVASPVTLKKMLFDVKDGELYGEYLGPANADAPAASRPKTCRLENFYCASGREWDVLAGPYMQE